MAYEPKNFDHLLGTPGFSDELLKNHFTLYQGYVKNVNTLSHELESLRREKKAATPLFGELKRRLGWEFDGMRLHELYFGNMSRTTSSSQAMDEELVSGIAKDFGSYNEWVQDFNATGAIRGIGWAILYFDPAVKKFFNVWVNEHDAGHFASCVPLLILDVFEHAYMIDYGIKRAEYIEAFFKAIDWSVVEERFRNQSKGL